MKVLMMGPLPPDMGGTSIGGVATVVKELTKQFSENQEIDFYLFATNVYTESPENWIDEKENYTLYKSAKKNICYKLFGFDFLKIIPYHFLIPKSNFERYYKATSLFLFIKKIITQVNPDILHVHHAHSLPITAYLASNGEIPIVTTLHSFHALMGKKGKELDLQKKLFQKNFDISSKLIAVSSYVKEEAIALGADSEKVVVIPNGININEWKPIPKEDARKKLDIDLDKKIVLFTGNLQKRKGIDILIESFRQVVDEISEVNLIIVGSGEEEKNLKFLTNKLGLHASVKFTGRVSDEELKLWYNACDVYCAPSREEAFGIIYLEAMACAKPVIGPDHGGPKEIIKDGVTGHLFDNESYNDLAQKIIKILEDNDLAERFGRKSRELIENEYNWAKIAKQTMEVYKSVIGV